MLSNYTLILRRFFLQKFAFLPKPKLLRGNGQGLFVSLSKELEAALAGNSGDFRLSLMDTAACRCIYGC